MAQPVELMVLYGPRGGSIAVGGDAGGKAEVNKGEMGKKIIHGCVEHGILIRNQDDCCVANQCQEIEINTTAKRIFSNCGLSGEARSMKSLPSSH